MTSAMLSAWTDALRSGDYVQGFGALHDLDEDSWCCLGVLTDVAIKAGCKIKRVETESVSPGLVKRRVESFERTDGRAFGDTAFLPAAVADFVGGLPIPSMRLMHFNDAKQLTFDQIADALDEAGS